MTFNLSRIRIWLQTTSKIYSYISNTEEIFVRTKLTTAVNTCYKTYDSCKYLMHYTCLIFKIFFKAIFFKNLNL